MSKYGWIFITIVAASCAAFIANLPTVGGGLAYLAVFVLVLAIMSNVSGRAGDE